MSGKINCWTYMKCGREPGGARVQEHGVCPAAECKQANGLHGGTHGGRVCWVIAMTQCGGMASGSFNERVNTCLACDFYHQVRLQEGTDFECSTTLRKKIA